MLELNLSHYQYRKLENHVENRTTHTLQHAELNIFETHQQASQVMLQFSDPVLASMIRGKKVMHLNKMASFDFLPGESVILPGNEMMCIDFPEATQNTPTQCLALAISNEKLTEAADLLNHRGIKQDGSEWKPADYNFHFTNDVAINQILQRLIFLFSENHPSKDYFCDLMIQELVIRILQEENKSLYLHRAPNSTNHNRLQFVVNFIRENIREQLSVELLSEKAHMSESNFYRTFKHEMGITPNDFIIEERLKVAESLLKNKEISVKEAYLSSGFNSFSYFSRIFKIKHKISPSTYRMQATLPGV